MAIIREARTYDRYPWDYSVEELASLFGIARTTPLLTPGAMQDSGWVDAMKMLENQLWWLSYFCWKRFEYFNTHEGLIACLYQQSARPGYEVEGLEWNDPPTLMELTRVREWIDAIRSDTGVPAWQWTADVGAGVAALRLQQVMELWRAVGLLTANVDWDVNKRMIVKTRSEGFWRWIGSDMLIFPDTVWIDESQEFQRTFAFPSSTRKTNRHTRFLFRMGSYASYYTGNAAVGFYTLDELIDPAIAAATGTLMGVIYRHGPETPIEGTGLNATWKAPVDPGEQYPVSGSEMVYFKSMQSHIVDGGGYQDLFTGSVGKYVVKCWQPEALNPYLEE